MSDKLTCNDCMNCFPDGTCLRDGSSKSGCDICEYFDTGVGVTTRFCRLASSVDGMAEAMVILTPSGNWSASCFSDVYETYEDAIAAAKKWLMEVEK